MVDVLTGIPSIVAALFIYAFWVHGARLQPGRRSRSSLALVILMMPVVVRSTEEMLKLVPERAARGVVRARRAEVEDDPEGRRCRPRFRASSPACMLGLARVMGETAPLLILGRLHQAHQLQPVLRATWPRCRR